MTVSHGGKTFSFGGGWHDAGDMSQQMLQTAEAAQELLELSGHLKDRDTLLAPRLREEGLWGLEFTFQSRFGDGNDDVPYWPSGTNATYKEVWLTPAGRLLSVASEF